jgi:hypothetical protein
MARFGGKFRSELVAEKGAPERMMREMTRARTLRPMLAQLPGLASFA